jgi:adenylate kinase family enzyme
VADLILVTGPPGAGKSTVARLLADSFPSSALVVGDQFFAFIHRGWIEPWLADAHVQNEIVTDAAAAAAGRLAAGGYVVVYDGVVGPWLLPRFLGATGLDRLHYVILLPPEPVCIARVQARVGHGFTDIPATRHMYRDFTDAPVDPRHLVTSAGPPEAIGTAIQARVAGGSLLVAVT